MIAGFFRLHSGVHLTALFLAFLSITMLVAAPVSLQRESSATKGSVGVQKSDTSNKVQAATASLQKGDGPVAAGQVSCSNNQTGTAYCQSISPESATTSAGPVWTDLAIAGPSIAGPFGSRESFAMAYDGADGYVVLFGGSPNLGISFPPRFLGDTWKFFAGSWTNITTTGGPSSRAGSAMAYDAADGYVVLFGGEFITSSDRTQFRSDTWKFSAGSWTNITTTGGPSSRAGSAMAYDAADNNIVLFGGYSDAAGFLSDTWKFSAGSWTNITPTNSPPSRSGSGVTYDASDGYVVMFGGNGYVGTIPAYLNDTWRFSAGSWTNITTTTGPPRGSGPVMADDAADGYVLLFSRYLGTWKFSAGSWTNINPTTSPPASSAEDMAYDVADGYILLFDGLDTWKFSSPVSPPSFDYSLSNEGPLVIQPGSSGSVTIKAILTVGTPQSITLSCVTPLPSGISCTSFNPASMTPSPGALSSLTISVASSVAPGVYRIQVTGSPLGTTTTPTTVYVSVPFPYTVGVVPGNSATYIPVKAIFQSTIPGFPSPSLDVADIIDLNATVNLVVTVQSVSSPATNATLRVVSYYANGTSKTRILAGDVATDVGNLTTGAGFPLLIPTGLSQGMPVPVYVNTGVYVNETIQMNYLGIVRTVNNITLTSTVNGVTLPGISGTLTATSRLSVVFDQSTGIFLEAIFSAHVTSSTGGAASVYYDIKISSTNLWSPKTPTALTVSCAPSSINVGRFTKCTATVTGTSPSGGVSFTTTSTTGTFTTSSCTLSAGACSVSYADTATSSTTATIAASYTGDTNNNPSQGTFSLGVSRPTGTIAVGATSTTISNGGASVSQASTGISVTITGSTASNGTPIGVTTQTLSSPSSGIPAPSLTSPSYYDVLVTGVSSGNAQACISFSSVVTSTTMEYWTGTAWATASSITTNGGTVCGTIPVSALTGTNIAVGNTVQPASPQPTILGISSTLFYVIVGSLVALVAIISAVVLVRRRRRTTPAATRTDRV